MDVNAVADARRVADRGERRLPVEAGRRGPHQLAQDRRLVGDGYAEGRRYRHLVLARVRIPS